MRVVIFVLDSLGYEAAIRNRSLNDLLPWRQIIPCGVQAPYTPSSMTTLCTGLYPSTHRFWDFPPKVLSPVGVDRSWFGWKNAPVRWASTNVNAMYCWPEEERLGFDAKTLSRFLEDNSSGALIVHLWETHTPYGLGMSIGEVEREMKALPDVESRMDLASKGIEDACERVRGLLDSIPLDETIVLLTADHGDAFGSLNTFLPWQGGRYLHQHCGVEETQVPLYVYGTKFPVGFARNVDFYSTVAQIVGEDVKSAGVSLYTEAERISWSVCRWRTERVWTEQGLLFPNGVNAEFKSNGIGEDMMVHDGGMKETFDLDPQDVLRSFTKRYGDPFLVDTLDPVV